MNETEYKQWEERIKNILSTDGETDEFIDFLISWMRNIKGKREIELLQNYHPYFKGRDEEEISDFITKARYFIDDMNREDFKRQMFDSAFFLYRPCLKAQYLEEN